MPDNSLLDQLPRIRHLPCTIVQGRYDAVCPIVSADELARVRTVLRDGAGCDPDAYFQWSTSDVTRVKPDASAWLYSANGNHYYRRDALKRG
jgi:hypothetical protein